MFATLFKSFFKDEPKTGKMYETVTDAVEITRQEVENMLVELDEAEVEERSAGFDARSECSVSVVDAFDYGKDIALHSLSIVDAREDSANDGCSVDCDDTKSEVSSVGETDQKLGKIDDSSLRNTVNRINSLQCPFTWNVKANKKKDLVSFVRNKYGEYNLDVSSAEFTFERYIGNIIIGYELFHKGHPELGQMKILEIGKWLEELDNGSDESYLSINIGLKHVMSATFIHMLFATNLIGECKWLLDDISPFANMNPKSRASVHAIHAAVLTEYGGNVLHFKKACEYAKKACDLDPNTSHWFYIHSLALTAQRHFLHSIKSNPTESEKIAIQKAIELSDGRNTFYNYHRMTLDRDTTINNYHNSTNKNDKMMLEKNLQENKTLVQMIRTIVSMEPKDPLLIIKCARTLMTLPHKVRDFKLGLQYLEKALKMAPNDPSVLKAVSKAAEAYKATSKNNKHISTEIEKNQTQSKNKSSNLGEDLALIVRKHRSGKDVLPFLTQLLDNKKYSDNERCKILAQICSYTLLFNNNLRCSVEHFMTLIEQPEITKNNYLIENHFSSFGSKKFNLADLVCNEIRLTTNASGTSSGDMLFYIKMLTKIIETCDLKLKDVDSSMKNKLIVNNSTRSTYSSTINQNEFDSSDSDCDNKSEHSSQKSKSKNCRKRFEKTGPKVFTSNTQGRKPESNKKTSKKDVISEKSVPRNKNTSRNSQSRCQEVNTSNIDDLKSKMSKFSFTSADNPKNSNTSNQLTTEDLRNVRTRAEIDMYTQQLYQNILQQNISQQQYNLQGAIAQQQYNLHNNLPAPDRFLNYNRQNSNALFQNPQPPQPLLSLRPQINLQDLKQTNFHKPKKTSSKKK